MFPLGSPAAAELQLTSLWVQGKQILSNLSNFRLKLYLYIFTFLNIHISGLVHPFTVPVKAAYLYDDADTFFFFLSQGVQQGARGGDN